MIQFFVHGIPQPKGSAHALPLFGLRYPFMVTSIGHLLRCVRVVQQGKKKQKRWVKAVQTRARFHVGKMIDGPVGIGLSFRMPRPQYHFRANGELKPNAPIAHKIKPDLDKLFRCTWDALTGIAWHDDSQVSQILLSEKIYSAEPGVMVWIRPAGESETAEAETPGLVGMEI